MIVKLVRLLEPLPWSILGGRGEILITLRNFFVEEFFPGKGVR